MHPRLTHACWFRSHLASGSRSTRSFQGISKEHLSPAAAHLSYSSHGYQIFIHPVDFSRVVAFSESLISWSCGALISTVWGEHDCIGFIFLLYFVFIFLRPAPSEAPGLGPLLTPKHPKDVFWEKGRVISEKKRPLPGMPQVDVRAGGHLYPFPI